MQSGWPASTASQKSMRDRMKAETSRCRDDGVEHPPELAQATEVKKQNDGKLPTCWHIGSSLSRMTLRSRMKSVGSTTTEQILRFVSSCLRLANFDLEPNQISSVLS